MSLATLAVAIVSIAVTLPIVVCLGSERYRREYRTALRKSRCHQCERDGHG